MARGPLKLWNAWATQILVLSSLGLQIFLLVFAGIRRRQSSVIPRFFLWLAYLSADSTAIYALGHLSLSSVTREHKLVAFWAPFLLLHLGGPDNITAYALQDNQLWLRHLQILVVQVLGAGYVFYKRIIAGGHQTMLLVATSFMFAVGLVKYAERTWALRRGNFSSIRSSIKELPGKQLRWYNGHLQNDDLYNSNIDNDESLLQRAHSLFHICKRGIVDSVIEVDMQKLETETTKKIMKKLTETPEKMWMVMEMELSLLYDILYTKADVIHSWPGYCIRALSPVFITTSFMFFHFSGSRQGQHGFDIVVTYILLGGGLLMETTSLLSALGSSWVLTFLCTTRWSWLQHTALCHRRWHRLRMGVQTLRRIVAKMTLGFLGRSRRFSNTVEQFNLLYFRTSQIHGMDKNFRWLAEKLGIEDCWDSAAYSWTIKIPERVKDRAVQMFSADDINTMGLLRQKWGELGLHEKTYPGLLKNLQLPGNDNNWHGVDFHESIIIWHIATDLILTHRETNDNHGDGRKTSMNEEFELVEAIRAVSNYLMFLLVTRPDMLPGLPQNWLYEQTCKNIDKRCEKNRDKLISSGGKASNPFFRVLKKLLGVYTISATPLGIKQTKTLAEILLKINTKREFVPSEPRLKYACVVAAEVLKWTKKQKKYVDPLQVLHDLWTDFLLYAANRCNRESHAKNLNIGGEFTTVVWLMIEHIHQTKPK